MVRQVLTDAGLCFGLCTRPKTRRGTLCPYAIHHHYIHSPRVLVRLGLAGQIAHGRQDILLYRTDPLVCPYRSIFRHGSEITSEATDWNACAPAETFDQDLGRQGFGTGCCLWSWILGVLVEFLVWWYPSSSRFVCWKLLDRQSFCWKCE